MEMTALMRLMQNNTAIYNCTAQLGIENGCIPSLYVCMSHCIIPQYLAVTQKEDTQKGKNE